MIVNEHSSVNGGSCWKRAHMVYECLKPLYSSKTSALQVLVKSAMLDLSLVTHGQISENTPEADGFQSWNIMVVYQTPSFQNKYDNHATNRNKWRQGEARGRIAGGSSKNASQMNWPLTGSTWFLCACKQCAVLNAATLCTLLCQMLLDINQS